MMALVRANQLKKKKWTEASEIEDTTETVTETETGNRIELLDQATHKEHRATQVIIITALLELQRLIIHQI